jgi:hypothetical protein
MAPEKLEILISADNKKAIAAIKETILSLDGVEKASKGAGGATQKMGKDFTGLSRVIQDMPYGFNAIANNLTNILPAAGAAGLAVSALVAGLQFASLGFDNWTRGLEGLFGTLSNTDKINRAYTETLAKEKTELNSLFASATNVNNTMAERLRAVKALRDNYGEYLKNYSNEDILVGKAADAHLKLAEALKIEAKNAAARSVAMPLEQKLLENQIKQTELLTKLKEDYKKAGEGGIETISPGPGMPSIRITPEMRQQGVVKEAKREMRELALEAIDTEKQLKQIYDLVRNPPQFKTENVKEAVNQLDAYQKALSSMRGKMLEESMRLDALSLTAPTEKPQQAQKPPELLRTIAEIEAKQRLATIEADRNKTLETANNLTNTAMNSITGMVNAMITGQNVGVALGDMFKRLAADIALAAAKALIFQTILSLLPGGTTGAALAKGEAGKGGFLGIFKKMLGFSEGGTVTGPRSGYPVMLHGTEHIVRPDQMRSIIASASQMGGGNSRVVVEGVVRGNDIWLSQSRTNTFRALTT